MSTGPAVSPSAQSPTSPLTSSRVDARVSRPQRMQREWADFCLDETLPRDDVARTVWHYVQRLDLTQLYAAI